MLKKNTIIFPALLLFSVLNITPFLMIDCTETDGSSHVENIFNSCCISSTAHNDHMPMHNRGIFLDVSRCKCSVNFSSGEYIISNYYNNVPVNVLFINHSDSPSSILTGRVFLTRTTESPPLAISLVEATVLLI